MEKNNSCLYILEGLQTWFKYVASIRHRVFYFTAPAVITVRIFALFCIIATNEAIAFLSEFSSLMISVENLLKTLHPEATLMFH